MFNLLKKFLNFMERLFIFTLKKIYSFFIYITLIIIIFGVTIGFSVNSYLNNSNKPNYENYSNLIISDIYYPLEDKIDTFFSGFNNEVNLSFFDIYNSLKFAINDENIKNIFINLDTTAFSSSQIEELKPLFKKLKETGKNIIAYGENIDKSNYSLALLANEITIPNVKSIDFVLNGYSISELYFKKMFDKYGINMEVLHIGSHKSFGETYSKETMSNEKRETTKRILDYRLNTFISEIAENRKINRDIVENKLLNGEYTLISPDKARDLSLVDNLAYYDELSQKNNILEENSIHIYDYLYIASIDNQYNKNHNIAIITLEGNIESNPSNISEPYISYDVFEKKLNKALEYENLAAIIIRINSGGGSAFEAKKIYDKIVEINKEIPVYTSISTIAASGGYYISSASDTIFINKASLTGSIGVVAMFPKLDKAIEKLGINVENTSRGKYVGMFDETISLTPENKEKYIQKLTEIYDEFKNDIALARNIDKNKLEEIAQGKIWLGEESINNGLSDKIGSLDDVIETINNDLNLENSYNINVIYSEQEYKDIFNIFNNFNFFKTKINIIDNVQKKLDFIINQEGKAMFYDTNIDLLK